MGGRGYNMEGIGFKSLILIFTFLTQVLGFWRKTTKYMMIRVGKKKKVAFTLKTSGKFALKMTFVYVICLRSSSNSHRCHHFAAEVCKAITAFSVQLRLGPYTKQILLGISGQSRVLRTRQPWSYEMTTHCGVTTTSFVFVPFSFSGIAPKNSILVISLIWEVAILMSIIWKEI